MTLFTLFLLLSPLASAHGAGVAFAAEPAADPKTAAREHFRRGVAAFDDKRFADAATEFETAYALAPAFRVLYNIGQVNVALGRSVEAIAAYERYLEEGAQEIPAERRRDVRAEIEKQIGRTGRITVRKPPDGAEVRIDGNLVGRMPLAGPVRLTAGRHVVQAFLAGRGSEPRTIDLCGGCDVAVDLELPAANSAAASPPVPTPPSPVPAALPPPTSPPAPTTPVPEAGGARADRAPPGRWQRIAGYLVLASGLVAATGGGVMVAVGASRAADARDRLVHAATAAQWDQAKPDYDAGKSLNQRGWFIAALGSAAVAGGIALLAITPHRTAVVGVVQPWLAADSGGVVVGATW